jgi:hypothetical protein
MGESFIWHKCKTNFYVHLKICTTTLKKLVIITCMLFWYLSNPLSRIQHEKKNSWSAAINVIVKSMSMCSKRFLASFFSDCSYVCTSHVHDSFCMSHAFSTAGIYHPSNKRNLTKRTQITKPFSVLFFYHILFCVLQVCIISAGTLYRVCSYRSLRKKNPIPN